MQQEKLDIAAQYPGLVPVNISKQDPVAKIHELTDNWGADVVFECSGTIKAYEHLFDLAAPGGTVVLVGMPPGPVPYDVIVARPRSCGLSMCSATPTSTRKPLACWRPARST